MGERFAKRILKFAVGRNRLQLHILQYSFDTCFAADPALFDPAIWRAPTLYWLGAALFIASLVQQKMLKEDRNKGLTVFICDDNKVEMPKACEVDRHEPHEPIEIEPELASVHAREGADCLHDGSAAPPGRRREIKRRRRDRSLTAKDPVLSDSVHVRHGKFRHHQRASTRGRGEQPHAVAPIAEM